MTDLTHRYQMTKDGPLWSLVGDDGGIHIWARERSDYASPDFYGERFVGGADLAALQARFRSIACAAALVLVGVIMGATLMAAAMIERGWTEAIHMQLEAGK